MTNYHFQCYPLHCNHYHILHYSAHDRIRSDFFKLLDKPELTPTEFSALHLKLHQLYDAGQSITVENMTEDEKDIAQDHISDRTLDQIDETLFAQATNSAFAKEMLNGLTLYRLEIVPAMAELVDRPLFISLLVKRYLEAEIAFARQYLAVLKTKINDPSLNCFDEVNYCCDMIKRLTAAELDYDLDD